MQHPNHSHLHSFKFTLVNRSHLQHSEVAVRCLGRHFLILYASAHGVSVPDQRPRSLVRTRDCQYAWLARSFPPAALGKTYEHHVGKALPTCSYTKNGLLTALVNCKARMVSSAAGRRHDNWIMKLVLQSLVGRAVGPSGSSWLYYYMPGTTTMQTVNAVSSSGVVTGYTLLRLGLTVTEININKSTETRL